MGTFRFRIPEGWETQSTRLKSVHVVGMDGMPKPCSIFLEHGILNIARSESESGKTYISFPFSERGEMLVCTGTMPESEQPYDLLTELARGTLNRLRNQTSIWREGGLEVPGQVQHLTEQAIHSLFRAVCGTEHDSDRAATESLDIAMEAIYLLCEQFGDQVSEYRLSQSEAPQIWLATSVAESSPAANCTGQYFDLIESVSTSQITAWGKPCILGPLLDISPMSSFSTLGADLMGRRMALLARSRAVLDSLPKKTALIHAVCGLSGVGHRFATRHEQFQLASDVLNLVDAAVSNVPILVSFDYPWAEKSALAVGAAHPLQVAEDLMRNGVRISYLGLDINLDYWPNGSIARDPLQWIDAIDIWCQLGLPLVLCLRVPQGVPPAEISKQFNSRQGNSELESRGKGNVVRGNLTDERRMQLLQTILPMAVARPRIHGILWRQWADSDDLRFPQAGMVDATGAPKPVAQLISNLRLECIQKNA